METREVRAITRKARRDFEFQLALKATVEPKQFWNYANSVLKTRSKFPSFM